MTHERNQNIISLREQGVTYQYIGDKYSLSRERVRQIINECKRQDLTGIKKVMDIEVGEYPTQEQLQRFFTYRDNILAPKWPIKDNGYYHDIQNYQYINAEGHQWRIHRLVWIWHNGSIPEGKLVDHINGIADDNKIENLRLCTPSQNAMNKKISSRNTNGFIGVSYYKGIMYRKKWAAGVSINKKRVHLGFFETPVQAAMARDKAAIKHYGEFATLNFPKELYIKEATGDE